MKTLTYGNTARATYAYDSTARTTGIRHSKSDGTLLAGYEYSYNAAGIPTGVVEGSSDRVTWSYDSAYRLTREQRSGTNAYDLTYTWDGAGNRLTKVASGTTTTYSYNAGDALTLENAAGTLTTYAYDNAGNTTTQNAAGSVTTYTWDDENRMTGIVLPSGGGTWTMAYSPNGLRREKQAAGTTTRFLWDGQRLLQETDGSNATTAHYTAGRGTYGPTVSQRRSSTSSFLHGSLVGTIEAVTAADQSVSDTYVLDAWGRQIASSGSTTNPHHYIGALGYYTEPSLSLDYIRARWLRPATGGWLSVDRVRGERRYAYVRGLPIMLVDASGFAAWGLTPMPPVCGSASEDLVAAETGTIWCDPPRRQDWFWPPGIATSVGGSTDFLSVECSEVRVKDPRTGGWVKERFCSPGVVASPLPSGGATIGPVFGLGGDPDKYGGTFITIGLPGVAVSFTPPPTWPPVVQVGFGFVCPGIGIEWCEPFGPVHTTPSGRGFDPLRPWQFDEWFLGPYPKDVTVGGPVW